MVHVVLGLFIFIRVAYGNISTVIINSDPLTQATKGEIWPKPQKQISYGQYYYVDLKNFQYILTKETCPLLDEALERHWQLMVAQHSHTRPRTKHRHRPHRCESSQELTGMLTKLHVSLVQVCEHIPHVDMDESYELSIGMNLLPTGEPEAKLTSRSLWGALRGLETFSQLLYEIGDCDNAVIINVTYIEDYPRFPHRGVMVDTSRHFIPVPKLLQTLDAMAYNKLNVFHWHITDDQSFPYQSKLFPDLSEQGAYHPTDLVYEEKDLKIVIEYATERGIRVIPEFDVPGHTHSWGLAYPLLLTKCYDTDTPVHKPLLGPIDPTADFSYKFLKNFLEEVQDIFPDKYFHYGGNDVDLTCWEQNPFIKLYMRWNKIRNGRQLLAKFIEGIRSREHSKRSIVWQDAVDLHSPMPSDAVVQIWQNTTREDIAAMMSVGYHLIFSHCWQLQNMSVSWETMYECEVSDLLKRPELEELVLGGEACMWTFDVDGHNIIPRMFPRASAVAERLWSSHDVRDTASASPRLEEHACRMNARGIDTQPPNGPGFCLYSNDWQTYSALGDYASESKENIITIVKKSFRYVV